MASHPDASQSHSEQISNKLLTLDEIPATVAAFSPEVELGALSNARWLQLYEASFVDPNGAKRKWEQCERIHNGLSRNQTKDVDAVDVVAIVHATNQRTGIPKFPAEDVILLVLQFRPPTSGWTLEFPSGLIDKDETAEIAALRELQEETGYTGKMVEIGPPITYEPGITSSCSRMVIVDVSS